MTASNAKIAIVTGATSVIGEATAELLDIRFSAQAAVEQIGVVAEHLKSSRLFCSCATS